MDTNDAIHLQHCCWNKFTWLWCL